MRQLPSGQLGVRHQSRILLHCMSSKKAKCQHFIDVKCPSCLLPAEMGYKLKECIKHVPDQPVSATSVCRPQRYNQGSPPLRGLLIASERARRSGIRKVLATNALPRATGWLPVWLLCSGPRGRKGDMHGFQFFSEPFPSMQTSLRRNWACEDKLDLCEHQSPYLLVRTRDSHCCAVQQECFACIPRVQVFKFVTVVLKPTEGGNAIPEAEKVSDQARHSRGTGSSGI